MKTMNGSLADLAGLLGRGQASIITCFRETSSRPRRAGRLAELLLELCPGARLSACLLGPLESRCLAVRPEGTLESGQAKRLREKLASLEAVADGVQTFAPPLSGLHGLAAAIHDENRARGFLVLCLPEDDAESIARAEVLLAALAPTAAARGALEQARGERTELARFALVGQAFAGLAHELNNALNSMMLQASVVQLRVDEQTRRDLSAVRQQGVQAAGLVRSLQHVVLERREQSYPVPLNQVLAAILEDDAALGPRLTVQRGEKVPPLTGTSSSVKQLVQLLLAGALAGTQTSVAVRTETRDGAAALILTLAESPPPMGEGDPSPLDVLLWQNLDEVGRQAGQSLLRQLGGTAEVEVPAEGGVSLCFRWGTMT